MAYFYAEILLRLIFNFALYVWNHKNNISCFWRSKPYFMYWRYYTHIKRIWVEWIKVLIKRFRFSYCKTMLQMLWLQNIFCNAKNILPWTNQSWTDFMIDNFEKNLTNSGLSFTSSTYVDLYISRYDFDYFSI